MFHFSIIYSDLKESLFSSIQGKMNFYKKQGTSPLEVLENLEEMFNDAFALSIKNCLVAENYTPSEFAIDKNGELLKRGDRVNINRSFSDDMAAPIQGVFEIHNIYTHPVPVSKGVVSQFIFLKTNKYINVISNDYVEIIKHEKI